MSWIRTTAVAIPIILCICGCGRIGREKPTAGGSIITASSGSPFMITVVGSTWTCSDSDCSTMLPANSKLVVLKNGAQIYSASMNPGWSIDLHPYFAKLEVVSSALHAYANNGNDSWTQTSPTTIKHSDTADRIDRIVVTDPAAGRSIQKICAASDDMCKVTFTIGQ